MSPVGSSPVLIGRAAEFAALREAWARAAAGSPGVVLVGGEAGVGKSRLVAELQPVVETAGGTWLLGATPAQGAAAQPFAPVIGAFRGLFRTVADDDRDRLIGPARPELARLLPELGRAADAPAAFDQMAGSTARLFELLLGVLHRAAADRPVVLVLEDLHWADRSTLHLVDFLARNLAGDPVLLVATYRTDELHRQHPLRPVLAELRRLPLVRAVDVEPFARGEVAELLGVLLGAAVEDDVVDRVTQRSSGLAFFVEELAAAGVDLSAVPPGLSDLLQLRVDALEPDVVEVVRALAAGAAAGPVPDHLVELVTGLAPAELARRVRDAVSHQVLDSCADGVDFRHALMREVVEGDLLPGERSALHGAYARALEADPRATTDPTIAARIASHWIEAHDPAKAAVSALRAGQAAQRAYAFSEAATHLQQVLDWWDQLPDPEALLGVPRVTVAFEAGTSLVLDSRLARAENLVRAELDRADARPPQAGPESEAHAESRGGLIALIGRIMRTTGQIEGSIEVLQQAADAFPDRPTLARTRVLCELAHGYAMLGCGAEAFAVAQRALADAEAVGDQATLGRATHVMGLELVKQGHRDEGLAAMYRALDLARATEDLDWVCRGYVNISDSLRLLGRLEESLHVALLGYEVACAQGMRHSVFANYNAAEVLVSMGRLPDALDITRGQPPDQSSITLIHHSITDVWAHLLTGDLADAEAAVEKVAPLVKADENLQLDGSLARDRLLLAWLSGRPDLVQVALNHAWRLLGEGDEPYQRQCHPELAALTARVEAERVLDPRSTDDECREAGQRLDDLSRGATDWMTLLYISAKTASVHVSNILAKLDVKTRTQAAAVAHRALTTR